jgi:hypothetical protein
MLTYDVQGQTGGQRAAFFAAGTETVEVGGICVGGRECTVRRPKDSSASGLIREIRSNGNGRSSRREK